MVVEINKHELKKIVHDIYKDDFVNICKIHKLNVHKLLSNSKKLYLYIKDTLSSISDIELIYKLEYDNNTVGFFTLINMSNEITQLNGFHIKNKYRTKEVLQEFWDSINNLSKDNIVCGLYEKNINAINNLKKNGFVEQQRVFFDKYDKFFLILNKINKVCL